MCSDITTAECLQIVSAFWIVRAVKLLWQHRLPGVDGSDRATGLRWGVRGGSLGSVGALRPGYSGGTYAPVSHPPLILVLSSIAILHYSVESLTELESANISYKWLDRIKSAINLKCVFTAWSVVVTLRLCSICSEDVYIEAALLSGDGWINDNSNCNVLFLLVLFLPKWKCKNDCFIMIQCVLCSFRHAGVAIFLEINDLLSHSCWV